MGKNEGFLVRNPLLNIIIYNNIYIYHVILVTGILGGHTQVMLTYNWVFVQGLLTEQQAELFVDLWISLGNLA